MVKLIPLITYEDLSEIILLVKNVYDMDLSGYSKASLKRRVIRFMELEKLDLLGLKTALINTKGFYSHFIMELTVNVTEMFRDPQYYQLLNTEVMPYLASFPRLRLWSAGCSTGEEVYSLSIILQEHGLYQRSFIYGTDINARVLDTAKKGIYSLAKVKEYSDNYLKSGCKNSLSDYYTAMYEAACMPNELKEKILFSTHNLVSDGVFNEFQFISCRNVLIYFEIDLQKKVFELFDKSLALFGFLCLGSKESMIHSGLLHKYKVIDKKYNIYQKIAL